MRRGPAAGGTPVALITPDPARKEQVGWPEFLPDGKHFLYMAISPKAEDSAYRIGSHDSTYTHVRAPAHTTLTYATQAYLLCLRDIPPAPPPSPLLPYPTLSRPQPKHLPTLSEWVHQGLRPAVPILFLTTTMIRREHNDYFCYAPLFFLQRIAVARLEPKAKP